MPTNHNDTPHTVVVMNAAYHDGAPDRIVKRLRTFPSFAAALGYLSHNLPQRPELDIVNHKGEFVSWEVLPASIPTLANRSPKAAA